VILPEFAWWGRGSWIQGTPLPEGFAFTSDSNDQWLSVSELCHMVECL
jgi:UDP-N-acetylglucosamine 4,6-dehydratase